MDRGAQPLIQRFIARPYGGFDRRNHISDDIFRRIMQQGGKPPFSGGFGDKTAIDIFDKQHSLLVEDIYGRLAPKAPAKWRLAALLHDAPEYVIGDMISPVKAAVGPGYEALDERLSAAIHIRFGLPAKLPTAVKKQIKKADKISAWMEATQIAGFSAKEADGFFGAPDHRLIDGLKIDLRAPKATRQAYIDRHKDLLSQL